MTTATVWSSRRRDLLRNHKVVLMAMTITDGDTAAVFPTQLKKIYSYSVSPVGVSTRYVTDGTVAGGTITLGITDSNGADYTLYLTAIGI